MKKHIADPVLKTIQIDNPIILELINTKEFQRLHFIKQLGLTYFLYPGATHTRYAHSLGTYELSRRILERLDYQIEDKKLKDAIMISALLHDLGHGPMSHLFESISSVSHEEYTLQIITDLDSQVNKILSQDKELLDNVVKIISNTHAKKFA
jgi:HD superfamily phosphohydrolase